MVISIQDDRGNTGVIVVDDEPQNIAAFFCAQAVRLLRVEPASLPIYTNCLDIRLKTRIITASQLLYLVRHVPAATKTGARHRSIGILREATGVTGCGQL
jgi:hypothetical protein